MKSAKLGFLLGFSLFCLLSPPVQSFMEKVLKNLCKEYSDPCLMEMDSGSCYESHYRFFYNQTAKKCQSFMFTGCNGNLNNFLLQIDCDATCNEAYNKKKRGKQETQKLRVTTLYPGGLTPTKRKQASRQRAQKESRRHRLARHHAEAAAKNTQT